MRGPTDAASALEPRKRRGAWYTDRDLARILVSAVTRRPTDTLLDPSCGDGAFLAAGEASGEQKAVGIEIDAAALQIARAHAPNAKLIHSDFFSYAERTDDRFDLVCGNPPFIRYQRFSGEIRARALALCESMGVSVSGLTSSWVPFLVAATRCVRAGGQMAFVVPAEIGHAPYAAPLLRHLARSFGVVRVVAVQERLFRETSEDCWILLCDRRGEETDTLSLATTNVIHSKSSLRGDATSVTLNEWETYNQRLRPFLLPRSILDAYSRQSQNARPLAASARVGIGYVTGSNPFFHLRPSEAVRLKIPEACLRPAVRNGRALPKHELTERDVAEWGMADDPYLLLHLDPSSKPPAEVETYLNSEAGRKARTAYKCRTRRPWWAVPGVHVPDGFLTSLNHHTPRIVSNPARCVATNSVHVLRCEEGVGIDALIRAFRSPLAQLSCELEGHPLGGGLLKLEPREAGRVQLPQPLGHTFPASPDDDLFREGLAIMRRWRHLP